MHKSTPHPALASLPLGKTSAYHDHYDASLLRAVPRKLARESLSLTGVLPFHGGDIWNLYELSWLNDAGLPQVAIGSVEIVADSEYLVESKSFKLYLNSFNQTRFASWQALTATLQRDLSACVNGQISVKISPLHQLAGQHLSSLAGECIDDQPITITDYQLNPAYLSHDHHAPLVSEKLVSHLLKSNCLITHQPDWGSLQIDYYGNKIDREKLLRYLVSLRQHNEFHEHCVERIFYDLLRSCQPRKLSVYARYTRRGGLDINPWRSNDPQFIPDRSRLVRQ